MINQLMKVSIQCIQYNAAVAIPRATPRATRGTYQMKYSTCHQKYISDETLIELGFESLKFRGWLRKLCLFNKIKNFGLFEYLFNITPQSNDQYNTQLTNDVQRLIVEQIP